MLKSIVGYRKLILGLLCSAAVAPWSVVAEPSGEVIGRYGELVAYSNREHTGSPRGPHQCVALLRRYVAIKLPGSKFPVFERNKAEARYVFDLAQRDSSFECYANGGTQPPSEGDILCYDNHVAIVTSPIRTVPSGAFVTVFEQNVSAASASRQVRLGIDAGHYSVEPSSTLRPQGWIRFRSSPWFPVNLHKHFNHRRSANFDTTEGNILSQLPTGKLIIPRGGDSPGVEFDIGEGVIQLSGKYLPDKPKQVADIPIGRAVNTLSFLHATGWGAALPGDPFRVEDDTLVGWYELRYADGMVARVELRYGRDLRDWWVKQRIPSNTSVAQVGWRGRNAASNEIQLYVSTWANPRPSIKIDAITFVSAATVAAPFCVAITAR